MRWSFFELQAGLKLALWSKQSLQQDTGLTGTASSAAQITLGHNVHSPLEVDQVLKQAKNAGAKNFKTCTEHLLRRLCRLFSGLRWSYLGSGLTAHVGINLLWLMSLHSTIKQDDAENLISILNPLSGMQCRVITSMPIDHHTNHHIALHIDHSTHSIQQTVDRQ